MGALTPRYLMDLESRMQIITEREYDRLNANLWYSMLTRMRNSTGRRDVLMWLLSTAQIKDQGDGGNIAFDDLVSQITEIENKFSGAGLQLTRAQLEDTDGGGMDLAAQWSADIGAYMGYWPQKQVTHLLKNGETLGLYRAYDGKAYFAVDHPYNPFRTQLGSYANVLTGAANASTGYPGACPIDDVTVPEPAKAQQNLSKVYAYVSSIKMANGEDPRMLRPKFLIVPPKMFARAVEITQANFLAMAAGSGAAPSDVAAVVKALGYAMPVQADELAGYEDDKTYFVACESLATSQLGAIVYTEREAYRINYYGIMDDAVLNRADELEWHCRGRNVVSPGHPYLLLKCKAT